VKLLWPRLPADTATTMFAEIERDSAVPLPSDSHPAQVYAQVGGRVAAGEVKRLRDEMAIVAGEFGFGDRMPSSQERIGFDRAAARRLRDSMDLSWAEAGSRDVWSFVALVALPDVTEWRWSHTLPKRNRERWVASDLTRHTWARLWWQITAFEAAPEALDRLNESELNQFLERRVIGGNPRLLAALVRETLVAVDQGVPRRPLIRDTTRRLRRRLAFIDDLSLDDAQLQAFARGAVHESWQQLAATPSSHWGDLGADGDVTSDD
jgi:hypothetical protein